MRASEKNAEVGRRTAGRIKRRILAERGPAVVADNFVDADKRFGTARSIKLFYIQLVTWNLTAAQFYQQYRLQRIRWERDSEIEEGRGKLCRRGPVLRPGSRARSAHGAGAGRYPHVTDCPEADGQDQSGSGVAAPPVGRGAIRDDLCRSRGRGHPGGRRHRDRHSVEVSAERAATNQVLVYQRSKQGRSSRGSVSHQTRGEVEVRDRWRKLAEEGRPESLQPWRRTSVGWCS